MDGQSEREGERDRQGHPWNPEQCRSSRHSNLPPVSDRGEVTDVDELAKRVKALPTARSPSMVESCVPNIPC